MSRFLIKTYTNYVILLKKKSHRAVLYIKKNNTNFQIKSCFVFYLAGLKHLKQMPLSFSCIFVFAKNRNSNSRRFTNNFNLEDGSTVPSNTRSQVLEMQLWARAWDSLEHLCGHG